MSLDFVAERFSVIAVASHRWYAKIDENFYAQGINAARPDPGA